MEKTSVIKTVVIGSSGFIGSAFSSTYRAIYPDCYCLDKFVKDDFTNYFDLTEPNISQFDLAKKGYSDALILAAMSKVEKCETEKELSKKINVEGTLEVIKQLVQEGIKPIFFSSDYVFNGENGNYTDNSLPDPVTQYGMQKAEIEKKIKEISQGNYMVVRLSKVFSLLKGDGTLLDEIADSLVSGNVVRAAFDQIFCPTLISDVIRAVILLQLKSVVGVVNVCSPETWSRYDLALKMADSLRIDPNHVQGVSLDEIGFKSKRPKNTSIVAERLSSEVDIVFTPIAQCIKIVADNWLKE